MTSAARDPRTGLVELSQQECWELLESATLGRVVVAVGSTPDVFPVNYRVHRGEIVVRTEAGTKLAAATLIGTVAFEVDDHDDATRTGWSVVLKGHAREATHLDELVELDGLGVEPWVDAPKSRWLVIAPDEITGRRIT